MRLGFGYLTRQHMRPASFSIAEEVRIEVLLPQPMPLFPTLYGDILQPLADLLSLLTGNNRAMREVMAVPLNWEGSEPIRVLLPDSIAGPQQTIPQEIPFPLATVESELAGILAKWFALQETWELDTARRLLFSVTRNPGMYINQQFLSLAQAAELYHRCRMPTCRMDEAQYQALVERLVGSAGGGYGCLVREILKYGNEPSLRQRLRQLAMRESTVLTPLLDSPERFAFRASSTRNYYTHYSKQLEKSAVTDSEGLYGLTRMLSLLLQACFLREIGLPESVTSVGLTRHPDFRRLLRKRFDKESHT